MRANAVLRFRVVVLQSLVSACQMLYCLFGVVVLLVWGCCVASLAPTCSLIPLLSSSYCCSGNPRTQSRDSKNMLFAISQSGVPCINSAESVTMFLEPPMMRSHSHPRHSTRFGHSLTLYNHQRNNDCAMSTGVSSAALSVSRVTASLW